jgi:CheY-like chemotaxis protein
MSPHRQSASVDDARPRTVLVVEDEVLIRMLIAEELRDSGFQVIEAANADEAMGFLAGGGDVDLVFTDVRMPGAMDGLALARHINEAHRDTKLLITSGHLQAGDAAGLGPFIPKPYSISSVIELIGQHLSTSESM